jgi:zinc transport system ATP-binding protein
MSADYTCPHHECCQHHNSQNCHDACCLRLTGLGVTAGDGQRLLHDVNLHIHCGEIVAVIGPNGAGKSTLFKAILSQQSYTGTIHFETSGGHPARPKVGYVPQSPAFDPGDPLTVLDLFAAAISKWPVCLPVPKSLRQRVGSCLERVHGGDLLTRRVGSLSGGELQRVLLAMALEPLPHVLILDEPLSGVDIEGAAKLMDMLDELRRVYDLSILLSTHDFDTLRQYADQVILLKETVLTSGSAEQVLSSPEFRQVFHLGSPEEGK